MSRKVLRKRVLAEGNWLRLVEVQYSISDEKVGKWEAAERITSKRSANEIEAVDIWATIADKLVTVVQFRPPLNAYCLELPAGLVDKGDESLTAVAIRELREETGFIAHKAEEIESGPLFLDPGVSACNMKYVRAWIDPADPHNQSPVPDLQDDEEIQVHLFPIGPNLLASLNAFCQETRVVLDARLASVALGVSLS